MPRATIRAMDESDDLARLHDEENRDEFAIREAERRMVSEEQEMEREMKEFEDAEERSERQIEEELRQEHWGHEPERRPVWPKRGG